MAAPTIDELSAGVSRISDHMKKNAEAAESFTDQFANLLKVLIPIEAGYKVLNALSGQMGSRFSFSLKTLTSTTQEIVQQRRLEQDRLSVLRRQWQDGEISHRQYRDARFVHQATRDVFRAQLNLTQQIEAVGRRYLVIAAGLLASAAGSLLTAKKYNEALQEANASFAHRLSLMLAISRVQAQTGTASATVTNAARALVRYSLDNKATFEANLKTAVMLHDSLGMSVDAAAELATVAENYARVSFQRVADAVATVVDQTSLAADEAQRLGTELMRALGVITPRPQTQLPQVVAALGAYEGALKEVSGKVGSFERLITQMATPEGLMAAGVLGVTPDMIQTKQGIDEIMVRFNRLIQQQVGNSEGMERVWRLENVARMLNIGLTREQVSEMARAMELQRGRTMQEISLQERYRMEMRNLDQGFMRLFNSMNILLQQGLYPYVRAISYVINQLSLWIQKITEFRYIGVAAFIGVTVVAAVTFNRLRAVARAFLEVVIAVQIATNRLRQYALTQMAAGAMGRAGATAGTATGALSFWQLLRTALTGAAPAATTAAAATTGFWARILLFGTRIVTPIIAALKWVVAAIAGVSAVALGVVAAIGTVAFFAYKIWQVNKQSREETAAVNKALAQRSITYEQLARQKSYLGYRFNDPAMAEKQLQSWLTAAAVRVRQQQNLTPEQQEAELSQIRQQATQDYQRAFYTRTAMSEAFVRGQFDRAKADVEVKDSLKKIADATEKTKDYNAKQFQREQAGSKEAETNETYWKWLLQTYRHPVDTWHRLWR